MRPIKLARTEDLLNADYARNTRSLDLVEEKLGNMEAAFMQGWDDAG